MSSLPPVVQWWDEEETAEQSLWDAGVVDAGSESDSTVFHVWNNRGNASNVADMINVDMTVRDASGQTADTRVCGQTDAIVYVQFFDSTKGSGGQWGAINKLSEVWEENHWRALHYNEACPLISCSGGVRTISGVANSANSSTDKANYSAVKLKLAAKPNAGAGQVDWLTRISYQYQ